jgi:hypothetical protein
LSSSSRGGQSERDAPCAMRLAASATNISWACSPSFAQPTTGPCCIPSWRFEEDALELLKVNEELARLLLEDLEAARCDMGVRLFEELAELRDLNEKRELEKAKHALEVQVQQKELLLNEINHRVKNSLQIASSNSPAAGAGRAYQAAQRLRHLLCRGARGGRRWRGHARLHSLGRRRRQCRAGRRLKL